MRWLRLGLVGAVLLLGGLTLSPAAGQSANKQVNVTGSGGVYAFQAGAVPSGQTVLWENHSDTNHSVSIEGNTRAVPAGDGARSQPFQVSGAPRIINYSCTIHNNMTGQLQVTEATGPAATTTTATTPPTPTTKVGATTTTKKGATTTSGVSTSSSAPTFETLTSDVSTTTSTSTSLPPLAIKEASKGGGTSSAAIAGILVAIVAVLGGGAYALYRLRSAGN